MDKFEKIKSEINIGKSIESLYILKDIFSFLSEKQKLNIIIYNKYLQQKLDINIENYKSIKGIYRKGKKNGKRKEYDISTNKMVFEGKYLNGKGKEYDYYGDVIFEGEYLNWKRNGKGKEYYYNGKLKFKGEFLNGSKKEYKAINWIIY